MSCRSCKRLAVISLILLSVFGLLLNVSNDQGKLAPAQKANTNSAILLLNPIPYKNYCVVYDFWKHNVKLKEYSITLVLHSTLKYLHFLEKHVETWTGPISVAIFVPRPILQSKRSILSPNQHLNILFAMLNNLKQKLKDKNSVSVHLFYEVEQNGKCDQIKYPFWTVSWNQKTIQSMPNFFSVYPINVARNIARHRLQTRLFLSGDIEQLFSDGYEQKVGSLARELQLIKKKKKVLLVHRRFEFAEGSQVPKTKYQLKVLYDKHKAVQFHENYYPNGHFLPNLKEWFDVKESKTSTSIFMIHNYTNAEYEPQFVADRQLIPFHDESFPFRHRSNTHLAAELCRASFQFVILNNIFSVHEGIKTNESGIELAAKKLAIKNGYLKVVEEFKKRLDLNYPETKAKCPEFLA